MNDGGFTDAEREHRMAFLGLGANAKLQGDWNSMYIPSKQREIDPLLEQLAEEIVKSVTEATPTLRALKIVAITKIIEWVPAIYVIAVEHGWNVEGAHRCLLFAVKVLNHLRTLGTIEEFNALKLKAPLSLKTSKGRVVHDFKAITSHTIYHLLLWVWRDLCLKVLGEDTTYKANGGDVRRLVQVFLEDIETEMPQDDVDPRNPNDYLVSWDYFMDVGGKGIPSHWTPACRAVRGDLEHLYLAQRLIELRRLPSLILYRKLKTRIFPIKAHDELRSAIHNGMNREKFLLPLFDIFLYENDHASIEALTNDGVMKATDIRYHDGLIHFALMANDKVRRDQGLWALKQIVEGYAASLDVLVSAIHKEFPNVAGAYDMSEADSDRNRATGQDGAVTKESIGTLFINRSRCMPDDHDWKKLPEGEEPAAADSIGKSARFVKEGGAESLWRHTTAWGETVSKLQAKPEVHRGCTKRMASILAEKCGPFVLWYGLAAEYLVAACISKRLEELAACLHHTFVRPLGGIKPILRQAHDILRDGPPFVELCYMGIPRSKWVNPLDPEGLHKPVDAGHPAGTTGPRDAGVSTMSTAGEARENGRKSTGGKLKQKEDFIASGDSSSVGREAPKTGGSGVMGWEGEGGDMAMMLD